MMTLQLHGTTRFEDYLLMVVRSLATSIPLSPNSPLSPQHREVLWAALAWPTLSNYAKCKAVLSAAN